MQTTAPLAPASPIEVPAIESDTPVAVIPTASVAPLDGSPDGERINTFTLAPRHKGSAFEDFAEDPVGALRARVLRKPLIHVAAAFSLGLILSRLLR